MSIYSFYIIASYAVVFIFLGGLALISLFELARLKKQLAEFEKNESKSQ